MDLKDDLLNTRHKLEFDISIPDSTTSRDRNPDKDALREKILRLREQGMSYREIAGEVSLQHSRVWQILKGK